MPLESSPLREPTSRLLTPIKSCLIRSLIRSMLRPSLASLCLFFETILIVAIPIAATADDAPVFTLSQLLERAWEHNTDVAVARWRVDGARAQLRQRDTPIAMTKTGMAAQAGT